MFDQFEKNIFEIAHVIRTIPDVRKLIYHRSVDPLNEREVSIEEIKPYIFLSPVLEIHNTPPYDKTNFINISLIRADVDDDNSLNGAIRIDILCQNSTWEISNEKIRPLAIASLIADRVNGLKLTSSHKVYVAALERIILDKNICGYTLICELYEGGGLEDEF